jgi:hypothetical protein
MSLMEEQIPQFLPGFLSFGDICRMASIVDSYSPFLFETDGNCSLNFF